MQNHDHDHGQSAGNLKISRDVLATIARYATMEIEGVASLRRLQQIFAAGFLKSSLLSQLRSI